MKLKNKNMSNMSNMCNMCNMCNSTKCKHLWYVLL